MALSPGPPHTVHMTRSPGHGRVTMYPGIDHSNIIAIYQIKLELPTYVYTVK